LTPHHARCSPQPAEGAEPEAGAPDIKLQRIVAEAIYDALRSRKADAAMNPSASKSSAYVSGEPGPRQATAIDGKFYLMSVAREVLKRLSSEGVLGSDR
jgi:hypothetical protein